MAEFGIGTVIMATPRGKKVVTKPLRELLPEPFLFLPREGKARGGRRGRAQGQRG
jgi:hypothetical protein